MANLPARTAEDVSGYRGRMGSIFQRARVALAKAIMPRRHERAFAGAMGGRLYADWFALATSADAEIRSSIRRLIDRSRSLERDNDYQRGFLLSCQRNINGSQKYDLRADSGEYVSQGKGKEPVWQADTLANRIIEEAWQEWGKKKNCTVSKRYNWRQVRRLAVRSVVRDGNFLARKVVGASAKNRFGFALQIWEIDHLDMEKFSSGPGQKEIRFGIEFDATLEPVAYWLRARHPGDLSGDYSGAGTYASVRFQANEIYHVCLPDRAEQSIGYPWIVSAITRLRQLGAFEEAATIAARLGASKSAYLKKLGDGAMGAWTGATDAWGRAVMDVQPGTVEELPQGWDMGAVDWQYPNIETGDFRKAMLRGVASSLGVSYTTMGNDLEAVNFSSARVGLFDEREGWKDLQMFFSEECWELIFEDWLEAAIMSGAIPLPLGKFTKFNRPIFKARRWAFIKPGEEMDAIKRGIALRVTSRRQVIEDQGGDVEEVFHDNVADEALAEKMDLSLTPPDPEPESFGDTSKLPPAAGAEDDDEEEADKKKPDA